jgi:hypothetical protein
MQALHKKCELNTKKKIIESQITIRKTLSQLKREPPQNFNPFTSNQATSDSLIFRRIFDKHPHEVRLRMLAVKN